jgi:hypothetical protein
MRTMDLVRGCLLALAVLAGLAVPAVTKVAAAGMVCVSYDYHPNLARAVQQALIRAGAQGLVADGQFGPRSKEALRAFQRRKGLAASGEVDEATFRALFGPDLPYEGVTVRRNPHNAPDDLYRRECEQAAP